MSSRIRTAIATVILVSSISYCVIVVCPIIAAIISFVYSLVGLLTGETAAAIFGAVTFVVSLLLSCLFIHQIRSGLSFWSNCVDYSDDEFLRLSRPRTIQDLVLGFLFNVVAFVCGIVGSAMLQRAEEEAKRARYEAYRRRQQATPPPIPAGIKPKTPEQRSSC